MSDKIETLKAELHDLKMALIELRELIGRTPYLIMDGYDAVETGAIEKCWDIIDTALSGMEVSNGS